jgi:hypothetical protein
MNLQDDQGSPPKRKELLFLNFNQDASYFCPSFSNPFAVVRWNRSTHSLSCNTSHQLLFLTLRILFSIKSGACQQERWMASVFSTASPLPRPTSNVFLLPFPPVLLDLFIPILFYLFIIILVILTLDLRRVAEGGGLGICEMLFCTSLVAVVGSGDQVRPALPAIRSVCRVVPRVSCDLMCHLLTQL